MKKCEHCERMIEDDAFFCSFCGLPCNPTQNSNLPPVNDKKEYEIYVFNPPDVVETHTEQPVRKREIDKSVIITCAVLAVIAVIIIALVLPSPDMKAISPKSETEGDLSESSIEEEADAEIIDLGDPSDTPINTNETKDDENKPWTELSEGTALWNFMEEVPEFSDPYNSPFRFTWTGNELINSSDFRFPLRDMIVECRRELGMTKRSYNTYYTVTFSDGSKYSFDPQMPSYDFDDLLDEKLHDLIGLGIRDLRNTIYYHEDGDCYFEMIGGEYRSGHREFVPEKALIFDNGYALLFQRSYAAEGNSTSLISGDDGCITLLKENENGNGYRYVSNVYAKKYETILYGSFKKNSNLSQPETKIYPDTMYTTAGVGLWMREKPDSNADIVSFLPYGTPVICKGYTENWALVECGPMEGWMNKTYLK